MLNYKYQIHKAVSRKENILSAFILGIAALFRLPFLGLFPPGKEGAVWLRLPTALAATASIGLLMLLTYKKSGNSKLALVTGIAMTLMPWHIEQSRIYSPPMLGLTALLGGLVWSSYIRNRSFRIAGIITSLGIFYLVNPDFWLFSHKIKLPETTDFLYNSFKLISAEFIFYKNDSFWWGGLRTYGTLLPATVPFLLVGIYKLIRLIKLSHWQYVAGFLVIWFIAAANPLFPEEREFFLLSPYLGLIVAIGVISVFDYIMYSKSRRNVMVVFYMILLMYEHILFIHFYTKHYSQRVNNEKSYEKINF